MKEIFSELNTIDNVNASLFFSDNGSLIFYWEKKGGDFDIEAIEKYSLSLDWGIIRKKFEEISEAELLFSKKRIYLRKVSTGFVVILMGLMAPIEVVRLSVDLIIPELESIKKTKGLGRFFKIRS